MSAQESRTTGGWVGQTMRGKYRIVSRLGAGGWGAVYEAEHLLLRRTVAIKVLHPDIAADPRFAERFRREALAASRIGHPNIIEVLDLDRTDDGTEFMVLELLKGESLGAAIAGRGAMPLPTALSIFHQVTSGLAAAHRAGIVHRDMKPDNVFLSPQPDGTWFVKLLDFGIAKVDPLFSESQGTITQTGAVLGTPYYMPPEQARGDKTLDHRADIFSLGVVMYETLTGVPPFEAENLPTLVMKIMFEDPEPMERRRFGVPAALGELVLRMLAKDPDSRPASCDEILAALADVDRALALSSTDGEETVVGEALHLDFAGESVTSRDARATTPTRAPRFVASGAGDRGPGQASARSAHEHHGDDDDDDDENDTMIMASPLLEAEADADATGRAAALGGRRGTSTRDSGAPGPALRWPETSGERPVVDPHEVPSIVLSDSIAKPLPKQPSPPAGKRDAGTAAPRARTAAAPPAGTQPTSYGRSAKAPSSGSHDPTHVIQTGRRQRSEESLSNVKLGVLMLVAFTGLVTLSYWVVSHL